MSLSPPPHSQYPEGDAARQAIHSLRGYAYQLYASAIAWLELRSDEELHLEVAEDYAIATATALTASQVKDSARAVTLASSDVTRFLDGFVQLTLANPGRTVSCRYLSTAGITPERDVSLRSGNAASLSYWRGAAAGDDVGPLRAALGRAALAPETQRFIAERDDARLRDELLRRIHWDCGAPGMPGMPDELEQLLIPFGWDHGRLPAIEAARLSGPVLERILLTCTQKGHRRLTRADLKILVDEHARVSVPRSDAERLMASEAGPFASIRRLIPDEQLGMPAVLATRDDLTHSLSQRIARHGLAFVLGGSGMGKTVCARLAARRTGRSWSILDLRDLDAAAAVARLREALGELSEPGLGGILVDDLNQLEEPGVARAFAQFIYALRRRDLLVSATLYSRPSVKVLGELGVSVEAVVDVPDLTVAEVEDMVGGRDDAAAWAAAIHRRSDGGHPQLVQASIVGLAARGWDPTELSALTLPGGGLSEISEEKAATRARLIGAVPDASRALLYRLSLAIGRFDRRTALSLGGIPPAIASAGEALDPLIGPWIDAAGVGDYRVSPLLYGAGQEMLDDDTVRDVHRVISEAIMSSEEIDPDRASAAYVHGLAGVAGEALRKLAIGIIGTGSSMQARVSRYMTSLRLTQTGRPIFPQDMRVSGLLRLAQLIVCLHTGTDSEIAKVWKALWTEKDAVDLDNGAARFETMILTKLLVSNRASRAIPNWLDMILRLDELGREDAAVGELLHEMESSGRLRSAPTVIGMLFMMQAGRLPGVSALVAMFERLDDLDAGTRDRLLAEYARIPSEFALLINNAWLVDQHAGTLDVQAAIAGFGRVRELAEGWGLATLATRAVIAIAIVQDEYGNDDGGALRTLAEGKAQLGHEDHFRRATAKVLYRRGDYAEALGRIEALDPDFVRSDHIERTYLFREAAICAMHLARFTDASDWFARARDEAMMVPAVLMNTSAIGLRADAAYAAYRGGDRERVFQELAAALVELEGLLPLTSLRATHCYKSFGHMVLSIENDASHDFDGMVEGIELLPPGCCSNPEPNEGIKDLPQAPIESLWYLLASAATRFHVDAGIEKPLQARIGARPLATMEMRLRDAKISAAIEAQNDQALCASLRDWVDLRCYLPGRFEELKASGLLDPVREPIPEATQEQLSSELARDVAEDVLFVHCLVRILGDRRRPLEDLSQDWETRMGDGYPGSAFLAAVIDPQSPDVAPRLCNAQILGRLARGERLGTRDLFIATVRLVEKTGRLPSFQREAALPLDRWIATEWNQTIATQRFSLLTPSLTVPSVERALARPPGLARAAAVALAAEATIGSVLSQEFRDYFVGLATDPKPSRFGSVNDGSGVRPRRDGDPGVNATVDV